MLYFLRPLPLVFFLIPNVLLAESKTSALKSLDHFLYQYCFECHDASTHKAELDLEALIEITPLVKHAKKWGRVITVIQSQDMPPREKHKKVKQPSRLERLSALDNLEQLITNFDYSQIDNPGYEPTRRLSRVEYNNTMKYLMGVTYPVEELLPTDLKTRTGFENNAQTLYTYPVHLERYFAVSENIVDQAFEQQPKKYGYPFVFPKSQKELKPFLFNFITHAFRRPAQSSEVKFYQKVVQQQLEQGFSFMNTLKETLRTILVSPSFLMKTESEQSYLTPKRISGFDFANRISYFLWGNMPDDELFSMALNQQIWDRKKLRAKVQRMLQSPQARSALGHDFAGQWLGFNRSGTTHRIDPIDNPFATDLWYWSMKEETARFFHHLIQKDRPIAELLTANYSFINPVLSQQYKLDLTLEQPEHQKVSLETTQRRGILGHASILFTTSFDHRTSPIERGNWVLSNLLGTPPPPPPPNVGELPEPESEAALDTRALIAKHRANPKCSSCHDQIDPLGLGLEAFNHLGQYRVRESHGTLPEGVSFNGPKELSFALAKTRINDLRRNLAERMLSYALGRSLDYYDEPAIRKILARLKQSDRYQTLVFAIIESYPFQYKKAQTHVSLK